MTSFQNLILQKKSVNSLNSHEISSKAILRVPAHIEKKNYPPEQDERLKANFWPKNRFPVKDIIIWSDPASIKCVAP